jgi:hypothetical protein
MLCDDDDDEEEEEDIREREGFVVQEHTLSFKRKFVYERIMLKSLKCD